jgi:putative transposase
MELRKLNRRKTAVKLPKLGWVKFRASRSLEGETLRSATLTNEGAHWFVSLPVEDGVSTPAGHGAGRCRGGSGSWCGGGGGHQRW